MSKSQQINPTRISYFRVNELSFDYRYQRAVNTSRVSRMAKDLRPKQLMTIVVSLRDDGTAVVIDGQHRVLACREAGHDDVTIRCEVFDRLTVSQEAELFLRLNTDKAELKAYDRYESELTALYAPALEIRSIAERLGLRVTKHGAVGCVAAISRMKSVHLKQNNLYDTLWVLREWAGDDSGVYNQYLILAVSLFLYYHPEANLQHLVKTLTPINPRTVLAKLWRARDVGTPWNVAAEQVLLPVYNKRLRKKLKPAVA